MMGLSCTGAAPKYSAFQAFLQTHTTASERTKVCDCSGWQHHPVCARKYHFIIPVHATPEAAAVHGNIPALVEIWMRGSCKKPLRLPQYLADDAGNIRSHIPARNSVGCQKMW